MTDVRVQNAQAVIVSAGRDDTSILITLTAHHLAPHVPISTVVRASDNEDLAQQAGATTVINPASFAGLLLAGSCQGSHIAEYLADLAAMGGKVRLHERVVAPEEIGKGPVRDHAGPWRAHLPRGPHHRLRRSRCTSARTGRQDRRDPALRGRERLAQAISGAWR